MADPRDKSIADHFGVPSIQAETRDTWDDDVRFYEAEQAAMEVGDQIADNNRADSLPDAIDTALQAFNNDDED